MQIYAPEFITSLSEARDKGIAPAYFYYVRAKDRTTGAIVPKGFWTGDEDVSLQVENVEGGLITRSYVGGCGLKVDAIQYVGDLTDNPIGLSLSQIAEPAQELVREYNSRLAYCEVHTTTWRGGVLASVPQVAWVGIVDEAPISTPSAGSEGGIQFSIRSQLMVELSMTNPAKSSDAHQRRRRAGDRFSEYAATNPKRKIQWYKE